MRKLMPVVGLGLVVLTIAVGFIQLPQWLVLLLGALFTLAYIHGKWRIWEELFAKRDRKFYQSLLATYLVETVLVFALYWLGRGTAGLL